MARMAATLVLLATLTSALAQSLPEKARNDELAFMSSEEPAMREAFSKARATLDTFLRTAKSPPAGMTDFALKVGVSSGAATEYFWITEFSEKDGLFSGKIGNEPRMVKTVRRGQTYTFDRSRVVDWMYMDITHKRMFGNFTACALLTKETPQDREAMKKQYGMQCE